MSKYKELRVWNDSIDLAQEIYEITRAPDFSKDFGLMDQIRRAAVSVSSNIAEGDERGTNRESIHFFNIAKGSVAEVITQLHIACRVGYIGQPALDTLENQAEKIQASIKNLIRSRNSFP